MQIQTVFRAGNSDVVAIPKDLSRTLNIKTGTKVIVSADNGGFKVQKTTKTNASPDSNFKKWWQEFLKENSEILDELAVR